MPYVKKNSPVKSPAITFHPNGRCGKSNGRNGKTEPISAYVRGILLALGEDAEREGIKKTPERVEKALKYLTSGYEKDIEEIFKGAMFTEKYNEMVVVKDIEFYSLCEHHLLPFFGKCHIGYIPNQRVVGLSKLPRIVEVFSRRLQMQERLTVQIAEALQTHLDPMGVGVVMDAKHLCMLMRGVEKQNSRAVTSSLLGVFNAARTREEFFRLINGGK